jgi:hypothetical protein
VPRDLRTLQREFQRLATGTCGPGANGSPAGLLVGDAGRPAADRLAVYTEAYFWRLHDVLAEQHAALRHVVGGATFERLARGYLDEHPPTGHDLGRAGALLPTFLATASETAPSPWLAELAQLERLHLDLFVAADARPLALVDLQTLPPASLPSLILRPVPAFALLECEYDVAALYAEASNAPPRRRPTRLVVWRKQLAVFHRALEIEEWHALSRVARIATLAELGEQLAAQASIHAAAARLGAFMTRWIDDEILAS